MIALLLLLMITPAHADIEEASLSSIRIEEPAKYNSSNFDQLITLQAAPFSPASVEVSNGTYRFNYGNDISTVMVEAQWALRIFGGSAGAFYFEQGLGYAGFGGDVVGNSPNLSSSYSLGMILVDSRLMYSASWFPWKILVPFVDGGYQYALYFQSGSSGADSVQGGTGNPVAGAGLRIWLNPKSSLEHGTPWFLMGKVSQVFSESDSLNLASTSIFGGITIGL